MEETGHESTCKMWAIELSVFEQVGIFIK